MTEDKIRSDLASLPPIDVLLEACTLVLKSEVLDEIREFELDSGDVLGCLWAELLEIGVDPEEFFRKKGII